MIRLLAIVGVSVSLVAVVFSVAAQQPKGTPKEDNPLVGTWKLVSAKHDGKAVAGPEGVVWVKHVTPRHFLDARYDKSGKMTLFTGGTYALKAHAYEETPEYSSRSHGFQGAKGKTRTYASRFDKNKWYQSGKVAVGEGMVVELEHVWERVEKK